MTIVLLYVFSWYSRKHDKTGLCSNVLSSLFVTARLSGFLCNNYLNIK